MSDFSCYVQIQNNSAHTLSMNGYANQGSWRVQLPVTVAPQTTSGWLQLEDPSGPYGADGSIGVQVEGSQATMSAEFADPYSGSNSCYIGSQSLSPTMSWGFNGGTGGPDGLEPGQVPGSGHPVYLQFVFGDTAAG